MKQIVVKTQAEYNALPDRFSEHTQIVIMWNLNEVGRSFSNAEVYVGDSATINYVGGSATINYVGDSATINYVRDSAIIKDVGGSATIKDVGGSATIKDVGDSATIKDVGDSATIKDVGGSATINYVGDSATINYVRDSATINYVGDSATINYVGGSATIKDVRMNAVISHVWPGYAVIESLKDYATVVCVGDKCTIKKQAKTATVIVNPCVEYDVDIFADIHKDSLVGKSKIVLYKSVNPETLCDFYTGKIKYEGAVTCPDFDPNPERECGGGLHLSPTPELALRYNQGKVLKCEVALKDIVVYGRNIDKVRCRKVKVIGEA